MTWFYVDDHLHEHPKARRAGLEAMGMWSLAGSYCADHLTDGFVPGHVPVRWSEKRWRKLAQQLVDARLWTVAERGGEPGWQFHDWPGWQKTKEQVLAERAAAAERQRKARAKRNGAGGSESPGQSPGTSQTPSHVTSSATHDAPSRPVPSQTQNPLVALVVRRLAGDARKSTTTDDERAELWAMWAEVAGPGVDLDAELRLWLLRNAETDLRDPAGALLGWLRKAADRARTSTPLGCSTCTGGWLPEDDEGRPVPCPTCRPHLRAVAS